MAKYTHAQVEQEQTTGTEIEPRLSLASLVYYSLNPIRMTNPEIAAADLCEKCYSDKATRRTVDGQLCSRCWSNEPESKDIKF